MSRLGFSAKETGFRSSRVLSSQNNTPSQYLMGLNLTLPNYCHYYMHASPVRLYSIEANGVLTYIPTPLLEWPNPSPPNPPSTLQVEFASVVYWNHVGWVMIGLPRGGDRFQKHQTAQSIITPYPSLMDSTSHSILNCCQHASPAQ